MINDLKRGAVRFLVTFVDPDLTIPIIRTIKFERFERSDYGDALLIFREIHFDGEGEALFVRESDAEELVLDQDRLIRVLRRCFDGTLSSWPSV